MYWSVIQLGNRTDLISGSESLLARSRLIYIDGLPIREMFPPCSWALSSGSSARFCYPGISLTSHTTATNFAWGGCSKEFDFTSYSTCFGIFLFLVDFDEKIMFSSFFRWDLRFCLIARSSRCHRIEVRVIFGSRRFSYVCFLFHTCAQLFSDRCMRATVFLQFAI